MALPCKNCDSTEKTKKCFCGSIYICSNNCWKAYCDNNAEFAAKCKSSLHRLKAKEYENQRKIAAANKRELTRGPDGKFAKTTEPVTEKTPEQQEKDNLSSTASKQKALVKKYMKKYQMLVPESRICIRELKKKGKADVWYCTDGYKPLQSRVPSATTVGGVSQDTNEGSAESNLSLNVEVSQEGSASNDEGPPDVEVIDNIVQERKKISLKQFCAICNEGIGKPSKRLKCNNKGCSTHSSIHLSCVGLYPASRTDRINIQKSYFCSDHRPETVEDHLASAEENSDYEDAAPSVSPDTSRSKAKNTKKRKPSSVASEENKNSEEGAPFVSANSSHSAATKPQKRKTLSDPSKKSSVSKAKASKKLCQSSDTKSSTPFRKPAKSSSRTQKSLSDKSSASSPSIPNVDIPLPPSLQSAFPTVADPSQFSFTPTDPNSPSSVSSVQEFVTFTVPSDSSVGSGSNYALTQLGSCTNPVGHSTSPFSFSNNGSRTLSYYEM